LIIDCHLLRVIGLGRHSVEADEKTFLAAKTLRPLPALIEESGLRDFDFFNYSPGGSPCFVSSEGA